MKRPLPWHWILTVQAFVCLVSCGGKEAWGGEHARLAAGLARAGGVAVVAPAVDPAQKGAAEWNLALEQALERWAVGGLDPVLVDPPDGVAPDGRARVVVGAPGHEQVAELMAHLGSEDRDSRIAIAGRVVPRGALRLVATFEDPERPGLPVTVLCAADPGVRAALLQELQPGVRPHLWLWNGPEPVLEVSLNAAGKIRHETFVDLAPERMRWPERYISRGTPGGRLERYHRDVQPAQIDQVRAAMGAAALRAERWLSGASKLPEPALLVEQWMDDLAARGAGLERFAAAQIGRHALEIRLDVDAVFAAEHAAVLATQELLLGQLGPCALPWLPWAAAIESTDRYGGKDLATWLREGRGWPLDLTTLLVGENRLSTPHERDPARALLVRLALEQDREQLLAVWRGEAKLDWAALEPEWRARMRPLDGATEPGARAHSRTMREGLGTLGVLVEAPFSMRAGSLGSSSEARRLAAWSERGLGRVALVLHALAPAASSTGIAFGANRDWSVIGGDAAAIAWLRRAAAHDMGAGVVLSYLAGPSGIPAGDRVMGSAQEWSAFFAEQEVASAHVACLARMAEAEFLCLSVGQTASLVTESDDPTGGAAPDVVLDARRAGWTQVIASAGELFHGPLTVSRGGGGVGSAFGPGAALDLYGVRLAADLTTVDERMPPDVLLLGKRAMLHLSAAADQAGSVAKPWVVLPLEVPVSSLAARGRQVHSGPPDGQEARRVLGAWAQALAVELAAKRAPAAVYLRDSTIQALEGPQGLGQNRLEGLEMFLGGAGTGSY